MLTLKHMCPSLWVGFKLLPHRCRFYFSQTPDVLSSSYPTAAPIQYPTNHLLSSLHSHSPFFQSDYMEQSQTPYFFKLYSHFLCKSVLICHTVGLTPWENTSVMHYLFPQAPPRQLSVPFKCCLTVIFLTEHVQYHFTRPWWWRWGVRVSCVGPSWAHATGELEESQLSTHTHECLHTFGFGHRCTSAWKQQRTFTFAQLRCTFLIPLRVMG